MMKIIFVMPLMAISLLASCNNGGNKPEPKLNRWYTYEDWWNYCSNGNSTSEATAEDIGQEINVTVYDKVHKVRLIDVEHKEPEEEAAQAHCTFEFMNVITNSNGAVTTKWNVKEPKANTPPNNYNFPDSTLNDLLNNTKQDDCIFKALPTDLQGAIKEVNKKVGITSSYSTDTSYKTKLFPLAHDEMVDHEEDLAVGEGTKYRYYINHPNEADRIKRKVGSDTEDEGETYWLRSPYTYYTNFAWHVGTDGYLYNYYNVYNDACAVAPTFCI